MILYDLNTLATFTMVADELNFTTVAHKRNTVQSAVSAQIKKLETTLGKPLLSRGRGQTMHLTPEGEAFLLYARRILALSEEAVETVRTAKSRHILRLGTTVTLAMSVVADVLHTFSTRRPNVQIQIQCDRSDNLLQQVAEDEIDIAFMMDQGSHPTRRFVHSQPLEWVASHRFHMPETGPIPLAFLTDGRDLRRYALAALDHMNQRGDVSHLSPHPIGVRSLVQAGLALTVMPRVAITDPLSIAPEHLNLPPISPIAISAYSKQRAGLIGANLLITLLENTVRN